MYISKTLRDAKRHGSGYKTEPSVGCQGLGNYYYTVFVCRGEASAFPA